MLEVLKFIFSNFWIFVGTVILVAALCDGVAEIIRAVRN
jgi:hypothetical protein